MLYQKLTSDELLLLEIIEHPVLFPTFMHQMLDTTWEFTDYQNKVLADCNNYVSFRAGRAVGKSTVLIDKVIYYAVNDFFTTPVVAVVTPNRVHLDPLWREIIRRLTVHPFLRFFNKSINSQVYKITLANGVTIDCRIGGVGTQGQTVIGLHTPVLVLDEAGYFDWIVWKELLPTLNTWEPGFQLYVCGTPSGQRENNVLYFADEVSSDFTHHRVSARDNPRYSAADERRNREQYGGEDTDDFARLVLGEHGVLITSLFSRSNISTRNIELFTATISSKDLELDSQKLERMFISLPRRDNVAVGIDLGFSSDPTVISLFQKKYKEWEYFGRITLQGIEYSEQVDIINRLDTIYNFLFLAMDEGGAGIAVSQQLVSDPKFASRKFKDRLVPISFGGWISIGVNLDGTEIRRPIKQLAVESLKRLLDSGRLILAVNDEKTISELERVEASKTATERVVYRVRGFSGGTASEDHIFSSLLCFAYKIYLDELFNSTAETRPEYSFLLRWRV